MKRYIIVGAIVAIGVLYWAVANPNSATDVKKRLDNVANTGMEYYDKAVDELTDD